MKTLKKTIMLVLVLLAVFTLAASPMPETQKDRQVLEALSLMYSPMSDNRSDWADAVCQRMTAGGCGYFMENHEPLLWQNTQDVAFNTVVLDGVVSTLQDGSQVWKAHISIQKACTLKDCPPIESDLFLHVVRDEAQGRWLLNRILYGPYIDLPQFEEQ
jgi:hypothetical protein